MQIQPVIVPYSLTIDIVEPAKGKVYLYDWPTGLESETDFDSVYAAAQALNRGEEITWKSN